MTEEHTDGVTTEEHVRLGERGVMGAVHRDGGDALDLCQSDGAARSVGRYGGRRRKGRGGRNCGRDVTGKRGTHFASHKRHDLTVKSIARLDQDGHDHGYAAGRADPGPDLDERRRDRAGWRCTVGMAGGRAEGSHWQGTSSSGAFDNIEARRKWTRQSVDGESSSVGYSLHCMTVCVSACR